MLDQEQIGRNHHELLKQLWEAAVSLRGSVEPSDYKKYVLPIIFLRFLSIRYRERRDQLEKRLGDPDSDEYVEDVELRREILEDPDEYLRANVFPVPREARWEYIRDNAQADDIKIKLDDALEAVEDAYPDKLRGLLPRIFAGSNLSRKSVAGLINLFSKDVFAADHGGTDLVGKVYEYFIGRFADSEGRRAGAYFTPVSVVRTLVEMMAPDHGKVYDPCCGSGGMFVQSDRFTGHDGSLSFYGQESIEFTYRLCQMNLLIHGLDGDIRIGNAYFDDRHEGLKADYILANPPFNDGANSEGGWGADRVPNDDARLFVKGERMPLAERNANTMWMLHFLDHLKEGGLAGFVMATGELSSTDRARTEVRRALIEGEFLDCVVRLPGQLFANTQIPCSLWFLAKDRQGKYTGRNRTGEILVIDAAEFGTLIPESRTQKTLSEKEIERIASVYREFRKDQVPSARQGFCAVVSRNELADNGYVLTPGRYVGVEDDGSDGDEVREQLSELSQRLQEQFTRARELQEEISEMLRKEDYVE